MAGTAVLGNRWLALLVAFKRQWQETMDSSSNSMVLLHLRGLDVSTAEALSRRSSCVHGGGTVHRQGDPLVLAVVHVVPIEAQVACLAIVARR